MFGLSVSLDKASPQSCPQNPEADPTEPLLGSWNTYLLAFQDVHLFQALWTFLMLIDLQSKLLITNC